MHVKECSSKMIRHHLFNSFCFNWNQKIVINKLGSGITSINQIHEKLLGYIRFKSYFAKFVLIKVFIALDKKKEMFK